MKIKLTSTLAATLITIGSLAGGAHAALSIVVQNSGPDVVAVYSGSLDLTGLSVVSGLSSSGGMGSNTIVDFAAVSGTSSIVTVDIYTGAISFPTVPSAPVIRQGSTNVGTTGVGVQSLPSAPTARISVPHGYTSGTPVNAVQTFSGRSLASMGLQPGTYEWTWATDKAIVTIVPEPSAALLAGLAATGLVTRRRRSCRAGTTS